MNESEYPSPSPEEPPSDEPSDSAPNPADSPSPYETPKITYWEDDVGAGPQRDFFDAPMLDGPVGETTWSSGPKLAAKPVSEDERYTTLDVVRGVSLMGILLVNIGSFALIVEGRRQPWMAGGTDPLNMFMWRICYLLADTKFIMIFTMLFGAGIYVMTSRRRKRGEWGIFAYYRRMIFLALLGTFHGYFIWEGDILFLYGFFGLFLFPLSFLPPQILFIIGAVAIYFDSLKYGWAPAFYTYPSPDVQIEMLRGSWADGFAWRTMEFSNMQFGGPEYFALQGAGAMVLGMGLLGMGFLNGKWPRYLYLLIAVAGLVGGVLLIGIPTEFGPNYDTEEQQAYVYWGSLVVTFGWIAFGATLARYLPNFALTHAFASAGRMALTNYLAQSLICTAIFHGHGLALFQRLDRVEMNLVVCAVWIVELTWSPIWLSYFRFGPVEWLWRSVTYLKLQPILLSRELETAPTEGIELASLTEAYPGEAMPPSTEDERGGDAETDMPELRDADPAKAFPNFTMRPADEDEIPLILEPYDPEENGDDEAPEDEDDPPQSPPRTPDSH